MLMSPSCSACGRVSPWVHFKRNNAPTCEECKDPAKWAKRWIGLFEDMSDAIQQKKAALEGPAPVVPVPTVLPLHPFPPQHRAIIERSPHVLSQYKLLAAKPHLARMAEPARSIFWLQLNYRPAPHSIPIAQSAIYHSYYWAFSQANQPAEIPTIAGKDLILSLPRIWPGQVTLLREGGFVITGLEKIPDGNGSLWDGPQLAGRPSDMERVSTAKQAAGVSSGAERSMDARPVVNPQPYLYTQRYPPSHTGQATKQPTTSENWPQATHKPIPTVPHPQYRPPPVPPVAIQTQPHPPKKVTPSKKRVIPLSHTFAPPSSNDPPPPVASTDPTPQPSMTTIPQEQGPTAMDVDDADELVEDMLGDEWEVLREVKEESR